jgi:hypothetical protein
MAQSWPPTEKAPDLMNFPTPIPLCWLYPKILNTWLPCVFTGMHVDTVLVAAMDD